jgi:hypothetical protein
MASRHQVSVSEELMTLLQAMRRWPRDAIADFAFPQPRRPKSVILPRDRSKLVRITKLGLPAQRDITALPDGVRRPRLQLRAAGRRVKLNGIFRKSLPLCSRRSKAHRSANGSGVCDL